jgi:hypothetical protein
MTDQSWLGSLNGSGAEARKLADKDRKERLAEGKSSRSIILSQKDVLTGHWDASKILFTTIGGQLRPITADDLAAFRRNIATAQKRFTKGITAQQVIDFSRGRAFGTNHSDLELAIKEIKMAVPVSANNGKVRFITNAGPDSDVSRHHVHVEFMNYGAEAASGLTDPRKSAMRLRKGPLKIECDCGKWRYWYRYMATIGGYNAGRDETGFPKIRNPKLQNVACKHILRVMSEVQSGGAALAFLTKLMDKAKSSDEAKAATRLKQAAAEKIIQNQAKRTTGHVIKSSDQKRMERSAKNAALAAKQAAKPQKEKRASRQDIKLAEAVAQWREYKIPRSTVEKMLKDGAIVVPKGTTKEQFFALYDA